MSEYYSWDEEQWDADNSGVGNNSLFDEVGGFFGDIVKTAVGGFASYKALESMSSPVPSSVGVTEPVTPTQKQTTDVTLASTTPKILGMDQQTAAIVGVAVLFMFVMLMTTRGK
ncbi:hypothetical protein [Marinomonas atlantica]|uniref:hypothetical protein n=1 Tax=Marinomonas atlantica TaxID=1806668 RepID=UPI00082C33EC|nr:hypothetical protein [Marinomonas atlantica]